MNLIGKWLASAATTTVVNKGMDVAKDAALGMLRGVLIKFAIMATVGGWVAGLFCGWLIWG